MRWIRHGLIFRAEELSPWARSHALQPTPLVLEDRVRVFVGMRDDDGVSRIGWVDLDSKAPSKVLGFSANPSLDIGVSGAFDEFGVVPSAIFREKNRLLLYYAGYQRGLKARFSVFGGLAVSTDDGATFSRVHQTPVFERTDQELLFRVPHSIIKQGDIFRIWYGGGSHFQEGAQKSLPVYDVRYLETRDLASVKNPGAICLSNEGSEYRIGRPNVIKVSDNQFVMYYGFSTEKQPYRLGKATSTDGIHWSREDSDLGLPLGPSGTWDSEMMAYPAYFETHGKGYLLYNGNQYGSQGFGLAELHD